MDRGSRLGGQPDPGDEQRKRVPPRARAENTELDTLNLRNPGTCGQNSDCCSECNFGQFKYLFTSPVGLSPITNPPRPMIYNKLSSAHSFCSPLARRNHEAHTRKTGRSQESLERT